MKFLPCGTCCIFLWGGDHLTGTVGLFLRGVIPALSPQSSVIRPQSSVLSPQSSVIRPLTFALALPSSVLSPQSSDLSPYPLVLSGGLFARPKYYRLHRLKQNKQIQENRLILNIKQFIFQFLQLPLITSRIITVDLCPACNTRFHTKP